jgi:hypothetical protein
LRSDFVGVTGSGAPGSWLSSSDDRQGINDRVKHKIKTSQLQIKIDVANDAIFSAALPKDVGSYNLPPPFPTSGKSPFPLSHFPTFPLSELPL